MKKEYNVRLIVDGDNVELGFVQGLYAQKPSRVGSRKVKIPISQWKEVPESVRKGIAKKIGAVVSEKK